MRERMNQPSGLSLLTMLIACLLGPLAACAQTPAPPGQPPSQPTTQPPAQPGTPPGARVPPADAEPGDAPTVGGFRVTLDAALGAEGIKLYQGRVYVVLSKWNSPEPRTRMWDWFRPSQVFAKDIFGDGLRAGQSELVLGPGSLGFPKSFEEAEKGMYYAQAVARLSPDSNEPGKGVGDLYSEVTRVNFAEGGPGAGTIELKLSKRVQARDFPKADRVREYFHASPKLSAFFHRDVVVNCGVILPKDWSQTDTKTYPVLYFIGGFGGDHTFARQVHALTKGMEGADDVIIVVPDATNYRGHSVFADSANTGPWGAMLVQELLPAIDRDFGGNGRRYVTGISSGGWSSLWLQVTYPDAFAGCWSHCPDPVDFRDFQRINLYAPNANMYRDDAGERRPLARGPGGRTALYYDDFVAMETVMGPGGQIHSFEAVFSPKGRDGQPRPLFDRTTGAVDPETAKAWEAYDINLVLQRTWEHLGPKLAGKLRVYAGERDTFFLEGATKNLKQTLADLGSDAEVVVVEGMGHTLHGPGVRDMFQTIARENSAAAAPGEPGEPGEPGGK
ncbi:MAG: alpha/beta hydrolase [Planctomycetota bacterium]|nr:alpha/beta hydrolase [Planctomycetota bacterium]